MHFVIWDDHTGQRHEQYFDSLDDAELEAAALMERPDVEYAEHGPI